MPSAIPQTSNAVWSWPDSLDALTAARAHHKLLLENEMVRVVQTRIPAGQTVPLHTHRWPGVLFIATWSDIIRRDQHGNAILDTRRLADKPTLNAPLWQEPLPPHTLENVGDIEFNAVQIEIKDAPSLNEE